MSEHKYNKHVLIAMIIGLFLSFGSWLQHLPAIPNPWFIGLLLISGVALFLTSRRLPQQFLEKRYYVFWPLLGYGLGHLFNHYLHLGHTGYLLALAVLLLAVIGYFIYSKKMYRLND